MLRPTEATDEVLLDLSEVTFIDASFLGALIRLRNRMVKRNPLGTIRIVAASRQVTRIFEMCQLQTLFGLGDPTCAALVGNTFVKLAASVSPFATA